MRAPGRATIGVAFGGGSARGLAHVGVIRWFDEHRIPIDVAAGTSMGGLIGGAFATGMDAAEVDAMVTGLDWDALFGSSSFAFKNIRRKTDSRAYPSRLEFGLKGGIVPPTSLNDGEQVELLLGRIAAAYYDLAHFDDLPTPFRAVAVDLVSAREVVLDQGSLAEAMRATMSLPLIFPPVEIGGRVLVDGGAMNNVPADVVRALGADRVVAVNVGDLADRESLSYSLLGLAGATLDAMMRASTRRALAAADIVIDVPLDDYGSLDWRRARAIIEEGYRAAEARREALLPLAVSDGEYAAWRRGREARRRRDLPVPAHVTTEGFADDDARRLATVLGRHVGVPLDVEALERDITVLTGLDRSSRSRGGWPGCRRRPGLLVRARAKPYAPPFMMLGLNLENTTSSDFRITGTARYLAFDVVGSGSGCVSTRPSAGPGRGGRAVRPLFSSPVFVAPSASLSTATLNLIQDDTVVARYGQRVSRVGAVAGVNLGARSDLRAGLYVGRVDSTVSVGDPGLPEVNGREATAELAWRYDGQDSPVIPSGGLLASARLVRYLDSPSVRVGDTVVLTSRSASQVAGTASRFWRLGERGRAFVFGAAGRSFGTVLPTSEFALGAPLRLSAHARRAARPALRRRVGRLPAPGVPPARLPRRPGLRRRLDRERRRLRPRP